MIQFFDEAIIVNQEGKTVARVPCQVTRPRTSADPDGYLAVTAMEMKMLFPASLATWYDTDTHTVKYQGRNVYEQSSMYVVRGRMGPEYAVMDVKTPWTLIST